MNTLPALNLTHDNPSKVITMTSVVVAAIVITFGLFVGMQKLIENDQMVLPIITEYQPITLIYDFKEKPTKVRPKIKPRPIPLPQPKLVAKLIKTEPNKGLNPGLLAATYTGPSIRTNIKPNFDSTGGDARPIVRVEPKYPTIAARDGIEGWVKLSFTITSSGTVNNIQVLDADPRRVFNQAAKRALAKWKYKPNIHAGKEQAQDGMMVMLNFKLVS